MEIKSRGLINPTWCSLCPPTAPAIATSIVIIIIIIIIISIPTHLPNPD